jgi:hypothetical protein
MSVRLFAVWRVQTKQFPIQFRSRGDYRSAPHIFCNAGVLPRHDLEADDIGDADGDDAERAGSGKKDD